MATCTHRSSVADTAAGPLASGSFTPAADDLLIVFVHGSTTKSHLAAVTNSQGITFTPVCQAQRRTSIDTLYCFVANSLATAVSQTCTITFSDDNSNGQTIHVYSVSGMTRTGLDAIRQYAITENTSGPTPAAVFAAVALTGNPCLGFMGNTSNPAGMTPPTSFTEGADNGFITPTTGSEVCHRDSGHTSATITWGSSSATAHAVITVELDTSAAPGTVNTSPTIVDYDEVADWGDDLNPSKDTGTVAWQTGDIVVVVTATQDNASTITAVTATGLTFTPGRVVNDLNHCWARLWTAKATSNGSDTITITRGGSDFSFGGSVWVLRGSQGAGNSASGEGTAKTASLTRTKPESFVVGGVFDWDAGATSGYAFTPTVGTEREVAAELTYTVFVADWGDQGAAGSTSYGISGTASTGNHAKVFIEVWGDAVVAPLAVAGDATTTTTASATLANVPTPLDGAFVLGQSLLMQGHTLQFTGAAPLAVAGAATVTTTAAGAVTALLAVTGGATATTTAAGTLTATLVLAGAATTTTTASGELTRVSPIAGSATVTTSAVGTLVVVLGISGDATVTTTATAALTRVSPIAGAATVTTTASADLTRVTPISGAATTTTSATAAVTIVTGPVTWQIAGDATTTTTASGAVTLQGALSGAATVTTSATAAVTLLGAVTGDATVTTTATGALTMRAVIAGAAVTITTAAGDVTMRGALNGASLTITTAEGSLTVTVTLAVAGSVFVVTTAAGDIVLVPEWPNAAVVDSDTGSAEYRESVGGSTTADSSAGSTRYAESVSGSVTADSSAAGVVGILD